MAVDKEKFLLLSQLDRMTLADFDGACFKPQKRMLAKIPKQPGVYVVVVENKVFYVGQSNCLHRRIRQYHHIIRAFKRYGKPFWVYWVLVPERLLFKAESFLTRKYAPVFYSKSPKNLEEAKRVIAMNLEEAA